MNETIKMQDTELAEVRGLQEKYNQRIFQLGQLYIKKMEAEEFLKSIPSKEAKFNEDLQSLQKQERELIDQLLRKYGEGSLDLVSGTFVSEKKDTP